MEFPASLIASIEGSAIFDPVAYPVIGYAIRQHEHLEPVEIVPAKSLEPGAVQRIAETLNYARSQGVEAMATGWVEVAGDGLRFFVVSCYVPGAASAMAHRAMHSPPAVTDHPVFGDAAADIAAGTARTTSHLIPVRS